MVQQLSEEAIGEGSSSPRLSRKDTISSPHLRAIHRRFSLATIVIPTVATAVAIALIPFWGFGGLELALLIPGYFITLSGVEVGFHRLYALAMLHLLTFALLHSLLHSLSGDSNIPDPAQFFQGS